MQEASWWWTVHVDCWSGPPRTTMTNSVYLMEQFAAGDNFKDIKAKLNPPHVHVIVYLDH